MTTVGRLYRNRSAALLPALAGIGAFAALVLAGWALPSGAGSRVGHIALVSALVVVGLLLLFFGLGTALSCVRVVGSGIRVVNPTTVQEFAWDTIAGFRQGRWGPFRRMCLISLTDGTTYHAWGISGGDPTTAPADQATPHPIVELNALLDAARRQPSP